MQCCEFEIVLECFKLRVAELDMDRHYHRLELADMLMDEGLTTLDRQSEMAALARELQARSRIAA